MPSTSVTAKRITWSATRKNTAASAAKTNTIAVVIAVSRRDGQVTLLVSCRTSAKNLNGSSFAIVTIAPAPFANPNPNRDTPPNLEGRTDSSFLGEGSPRKSVTGPLGDGGLVIRAQLPVNRRR